DAIDYLRRIKREAEAAEVQRQALEEERAATAEKFAALDLEFAARERDRRAGELKREASARPRPCRKPREQRHLRAPIEVAKRACPSSCAKSESCATD